jgi:hypothetical protein
LVPTGLDEAGEEGRGVRGEGGPETWGEGGREGKEVDHVIIRSL